MGPVFWSHVCEVAAEALAAWVRACPRSRWPEVADRTKPLRIHLPDLPIDLVAPVVDAVMAHYPGCRSAAVCLSLVRPGTSHPWHADEEDPRFVTRIHVPLATNPGAWFAWQPECRQVHLPAGAAYAFDTQVRHSFGNDGETDRVHLLFDVFRRN